MADGFVRVRGTRKLQRACAHMPRVLGFMAWTSWYNYFSGDPFTAFMETMVHCPTPTPAAGRCPTGSVSRDGACEAVSRDDRDWSLSDHCADKDRVLQKISQLNGMNQFLAAGLSLSSVFLGGMAIDAVGRKPVLLLSLFANILVKGLLFLSGFLSWTSFRLVLVLQNVICVMSLSSVFPAMNAMVADISRGDEALRGDCYAAMEVVNHVADVLAFGCGFPVLSLHLGDYRVFWGALMVVSACAFVAFCFILEETRTLADENLEAARELGHDHGDAGSGPGRASLFHADCIRGFRVAWQDPFLRAFFPIWAVTSAGIDCTWGLSQMHLQSFMHMGQATASMSRALWHVALTCGAGLSSPLIHGFGAKRTMSIGLAVIAVAWGLCGMGGIFPDAASVLFWGCGVGLGGMACGTLMPCFNTIVSSRIGEDLQGKMFSTGIIVNTVIGMSISLWWPFYLFNPFATGWRIGRMWFVSAGIFLTMLLCFALLCAAHGATPPPGRQEAALSSSGGEASEDSDGAGSSSGATSAGGSG